MSFLLDPPSLFLSGLLIGRFMQKGQVRTILAALVVLLFLIFSALLYLDMIGWWYGDWIQGSDWMLNSGFGTDMKKEKGMDMIAVIVFASYPLWMKLGLDIGSRGD
ncbi:MAG: hypothetical protein OIN88_04370 [Candidatus Methanoperedens sp.]|nr:hypothetical protein [Candidatus Methanoperedens sp.]HLB72177.1 hypothetical protein [Candidatus Methanoperedens sp.]